MPRILSRINGKLYTAEIDPRTLLLDFIRDHAGLTGSKRGCNEGKCGARRAHREVVQPPRHAGAQ